MATVSDFEELEIWKQSRQLSREVYNLVDNEVMKKDRGLAQQMLNSSGSVMDNIAEGFERNGNKEFVQALFIAKGSLGELRSQLIRCFDRKLISEAELKSFKENIRGIGSKTWNLVSYLKSSELKGIKFSQFPKAAQSKL